MNEIEKMMEAHPKAQRVVIMLDAKGNPTNDVEKAVESKEYLIEDGDIIFEMTWRKGGR